MTLPDSQNKQENRSGEGKLRAVTIFFTLIAAAGTSIAMNSNPEGSNPYFTAQLVKGGLTAINGLATFGYTIKAFTPDSKEEKNNPNGESDFRRSEAFKNALVSFLNTSIMIFPIG